MSQYLAESNLYETEDSPLRIGDRLAEGKWAEWVDGIADARMRGVTAIMLENEQRYIHNLVRASSRFSLLNETTLMSSPGIATLENQMFPLIRGMLPNLILSEIVSVQPMLGEHSSIFYMNFQYGTSKGGVTKGDTLFDTVDRNYSSEVIEDEIVGTGDTTTTPTISALDFGKVRKGTVFLTDGVLEVRDNGAGGFTGDASAGSIDYITGAITGLTWSSGTAASAAITANYEYDSEGSTEIPQIDIVLASAPIVARPRKLRFRYSMEAGLGLQRNHAVDADAELTTIAAEQMKFEIDREGIDILRRHAGAGSVEFSTSAPTGVDYQAHKQSFIDALVAGGNKIFRATRRVMANWVVLGEDAANIVETLPQFVPSGLASGMGVMKIGVLGNRWVCYKDPYIGQNEFLLGYKGNSFLETGFVWAPYIALAATPNTMLDDFIARKGLLTSYGKKMVNNKMYVSGTITS